MEIKLSRDNYGLLKTDRRVWAINGIYSHPRPVSIGPALGYAVNLPMYAKAVFAYIVSTGGKFDINPSESWSSNTDWEWVEIDKTTLRPSGRTLSKSHSPAQVYRLWTAPEISTAKDRARVSAS